MRSELRCFLISLPSGLSREIWSRNASVEAGRARHSVRAGNPEHDGAHGVTRPTAVADRL